MRLIAVCSLLLLSASSASSQALISRRVYAEKGRSWRELWLANAETLDFKQATHSLRDHMEPVCSRDGKAIYFVSDRDGERSRNDYAGATDREVWILDRKTGSERQLWATSDENGLHLSGTTANGDVLIRVANELRSLPGHTWRVDRVDPADNAVAVSPDGRMVATVIAGSIDKEGQTHNSRLFLVDGAASASRILLGKYQSPAWSPDGSRVAAVGEDGLAIIDVVTHQLAKQWNWPRSDRGPEEVVWSPDQKHIIAGFYGDAAGSGDPQRDYYLLDIGASKWARVLTAQRVVWLPDQRLLYLGPVTTEALGGHSIWTAPLGVWDLSTRQTRTLSSGRVLNDFVAICTNHESHESTARRASTPRRRP